MPSLRSFDFCQKSKIEYMIFRREKNPFKGWFWWWRNSYTIWGAPSGIKLLYFVLFLGLIFTFVIAFPSLFKWIRIGPWLLFILILIFSIDFLSFVIATKLSPIYRVNIFELTEEGITFVENKNHQGKILYKDIRKIFYSRYLAGEIAGLFMNKILFYFSNKLAHFCIEYSTPKEIKCSLPVPPDLPKLSFFLETVIQKSNLIKTKPSKWSLFAEWQKREEAMYPVEINEKYRLYPSLISPKQLEIGRNFIIFLAVLFLVLLILFVILSHFL